MLGKLHPTMDNFFSSLPYVVIFSLACTWDCNPTTLAEENMVLINHSLHFVNGESLFYSQTTWDEMIMCEGITSHPQVSISSFIKWEYNLKLNTSRVICRTIEICM